MQSFVIVKIGKTVPKYLLNITYKKCEGACTVDSLVDSDSLVVQWTT